MDRGYTINENRIIIDFENLYCETAEKMMRAGLFHDMLRRYMRSLETHESPLLQQIHQCLPQISREELPSVISTLLKLLVNHHHQELADINPLFGAISRCQEALYEFVEGLYDFWRGFERYLLLSAPITRLRTRQSIYPSQFITANETLRHLILNTYRTVCANLIDEPFRVYRQLPAGADVGFMTQAIEWKGSESYGALKSVPFIRLALLEPPVIFNTRRNTRQGVFEEIDTNPAIGLTFPPDEWFCYPAKIGQLLAFAYFHRDFMAQGAALSNLFELANYEDIAGKSPDIILLFGAEKRKHIKNKTVFYHDREKELLIGCNTAGPDIDYFGYMKKMLLTLHNVRMIEQGHLPVHGAMVTIRMKGKSANLVIVGDSGAGKSETLEAFRLLAKDQINEMTIIFDDMGTLTLPGKNRPVLGFGTEIGAFLRLDDLQPGYAFDQMDRSIFMNAHQTNARVIIPVTTYKKITQGEPVHYLLYANNYEEVNSETPAVARFSTPDEAYPVFSSGKRMAKGTTAELGLVESYFANPFGAPQRRERHDKLARQMLNTLFDSGIYVGQIRTQLGCEGMGQKGPQIAARALMDLISGK